MTQTTRERILNLLVNGDGKTFAGSGDDYGLHGPADAIAAEIDFTAAQRDGAYVAHNEVNDDLIRARKQIENLFGALAVCTNERDTLRAELAEARADLASAQRQCDQLSETLVRERDAYAAQGAILAAARYEAGRLDTLLGEAKAENERLRAAQHQSTLDWAEIRKIEQSLLAEVERLRPAAEAWEALMVLRDAEMGSTSVGLNLARDAYGAAANRARAANGDTLAHEAALKSAHVRGDA